MITGEALLTYAGEMAARAQRPDTETMRGL